VEEHTWFKNDSKEDYWCGDYWCGDYWCGDYWCGLEFTNLTAILIGF